MPDQPSVFAADASSDQVTCSAKGCRQSPSYAVVWNNPKVHTPEREKIWLACEDHREWLASFLDKRGFLLRVDDL